MAANPAFTTGFVSTNSITQGEQVGALWPDLLARGVKIHFAHRTFQWSSEARGKAAVHCVIIGFALRDNDRKRLFDYEDIRSEPHEVRAGNINPYLVDAPDLIISRRGKPLCVVPEIGIGNKPIDGGHYLFTTAERDSFIQQEPASASWFRRWLGASEFLNGVDRWFLWIGECPPNQLRAMPLVIERVAAVKKFRLASKSAPTRKLGGTPTRFHVENIPKGTYLIFPRHSSESRRYLPIGFGSTDVLVGDACLVSERATPYHLGVLSSDMHMSWVRGICGRIKSDYRYSAAIVYNNFPWPDPTNVQRTAIETAAQAVLDARALYPNSTLADLYDPLSMPPELVKAHRKLDQAVDAAYARKKFTGDSDRVAFLFERYQALAGAS